MHPLVKKIPKRILGNALGALAQANQHAVYFDPGNEHWGYMSVINAAHAGELFMKAVIAKEHPLLIFKDLFGLDDGAQEVELHKLISKGRTHDFEKLPEVMWAVTGDRIANPEAFQKLRKLRNAVQHFCADDSEDFRGVSLNFIYSVIDPLIKRHFDLYAIEYHEDHGVGYDYVVSHLVRSEIKFSIPHDFALTEIDLAEEARSVDGTYRSWLSTELVKIGKSQLLQ